MSFNPDMPKRRPPYLQKHTSRHGRVNWYVRIGRGPKIRIRGEYGSPDFINAYNAAISGQPVQSKTKLQPHTMAWLIGRYKESALWALSSPGTKKQRDHFYQGLLKTAGDVPYSAIQKIHIINAIDKRKETPGAANNYLRAVRALFKWAVDADYIKEDPTAGVKKLQYQSKGFPAWTMDEVDQFRDCWPAGTRERLAMELLFWTGLRRSDVVRLGRQHIKDGVAMLVAEKTKEQLYLTIPNDLQRLIDRSPTGDLAIISTESGNPRNKDAFGNWFRKICTEAGVSKSAHGLRKLAASVLAEAGGTEKELQAAFGWRSERQSQLYTRAADRKHLSMQASKKRENQTAMLPPIVKVGASARKKK